MKQKKLEKILSEKQTIFFRKDHAETPFRVIVYCSEKKLAVCDFVVNSCFAIYADKSNWLFHKGDKAFRYDTDRDAPLFRLSCTRYEDILFYGIKQFSNGNPIYGWKISQLKIYLEPKRLSDFGFTRPPRNFAYVRGLQDEEK